MKVAVIGSRNLHIRNLADYLPEETTELIRPAKKSQEAKRKVHRKFTIKRRRKNGYDKTDCH